MFFMISNGETLEIQKKMWRTMKQKRICTPNIGI